MTLQDYRIYKSVLWFIVENEKLPALQDVTRELSISYEMAQERIRSLESEGILKSMPEGIKILKDVIWCEKKKRPCCE